MKIGIIGSNGYIGRNMSHYLSLVNENEIYNFDIHQRSNFESNNYCSLDITNKKDLLNIPDDLDFIFLFSGITGTLDSFQNYEDVFKVNILGLTNILNHLIDKNISLVFPSTRLVFKGNENIDLGETNEKYPLTPYAISKLMGEQLIESYSNLYNLNYYIFRICVPFGNLINNDYSYGTLGIFLNQINTDKKITLFGNGKQKRTFTHLLDIYDIFEKTLNDEVTCNEIYNVGGENLTLKQVANLFAKKYDVPVDFKSWPESYKKIESGSTSFASIKIDTMINKKQYNSLSDFIERELEL